MGEATCYIALPVTGDDVMAAHAACQAKAVAALGGTDVVLVDLATFCGPTGKALGTTWRRTLPPPQEPAPASVAPAVVA